MISQQNDIKVMKEDIEDIRHRRNYQQDFIPTAIKKKMIGEIVESFYGDISSGSVPNGSYVIFSHTVEHRNDALIMATPDVSIYIGSVIAGNQLPGGVANPALYTVIGPWNDYEATDSNNVVTKVYVMNNSGSTQTISTQWFNRIIYNYPDPSV